MFHNCGHCEPFMDFMVSFGVQMLDPMQASNDLVADKEKYRGKLSFMGGWEWALHMPPDYPSFDEEALRQPFGTPWTSTLPAAHTPSTTADWSAITAIPLWKSANGSSATRPIGTAEKSTATQANNLRGTTSRPAEARDCKVPGFCLLWLWNPL